MLLPYFLGWWTDDILICPNVFHCIFSMLDSYIWSDSLELDLINALIYLKPWSDRLAHAAISALLRMPQCVTYGMWQLNDAWIQQYEIPGNKVNSIYKRLKPIGIKKVCNCIHNLFCCNIVVILSGNVDLFHNMQSWLVWPVGPVPVWFMASGSQ